MAYCESQLDKSNREWFQNDTSKNTLLKIAVSNGNIRGIYDSEVEFKYPISAFVGENGSGKSTYLALIACAFHNITSFCPFNRIRINNKKPRYYYTYGDFFTFAPSETGIKGIQIKAEYLTETGLKVDIRKKKPSGKWNDFKNRPKRAVSFLGMNRIIPPSESTPHKSYYKSFQNQNLLDNEKMNLLRSYLCRILGRDYSNISIMTHNSYRLFSVQRHGIGYTGFNMGAGENAVIQLLLEILSAGKGALIVIDEIELGLHAKAQKELINVLKDICDKFHTQIICSTHSKAILDELPLEARFFIQRTDKQTVIIPKISSEFAFAKLSGTASSELDIFVEDSIAKMFISNIIPGNIRERVSIHVIGSAEAVLRQIAAHYRERKYNFIAFLDGDQRAGKNSQIEKIKNYLETILYYEFSVFRDMMNERLCYLPGEQWPERTIVEGILSQGNLEKLKENWNLSNEEIQYYFESALSAEKHSEFYEIAEKTN